MTEKKQFWPLETGYYHPEPLQLAEILAAVKGRAVMGRATGAVTGVSVDSRTVREGQLFVALHGERFDGHQFVSQALKRKAGAALIQAGRLARKEIKNQGRALVIEVPDSLKALGELAAYVRQKFSLPLVAITGSNGKSTTKEMVAAILKLTGPVLKSPGNYNNLVGLPLTLLSLSSQYKWAVVELGMNRPGEIKRLSEISRPDVAVVTNIGPVHLEGLGNLEEVAKAKGEILAGLRENGTIVFNADDPVCCRLFGRARYQRLSFGMNNAGAKVSVGDYVNHGLQGMEAVFKVGGKTINVVLKACGRHNLENATAAAAVAKSLGTPLHLIKEGLERCELLGRRTEVVFLNGGITLIDDSYNANPRSMEAALQFVQEVGRGKRRVALLGDMLELGDYATEAHCRLGSQAVEVGIDRLLFLGRYGLTVAKGAMKAGLCSKAIGLCHDYEEATTLLAELLREGDILLVKASRAVGLEKVVESLKEKIGVETA